MMEYMGRQTVRGIICNEAGQLLMIERHKGSEHYFVLPGGHIEEGETAEAALAREIAEETGLAVEPLRLIHAGEDALGNQQKIFLCNYNGGQPALTPGSVEALAMQNGDNQHWKPGWFSRQELEGQVVYPAWLLERTEFGV